MPCEFAERGWDCEPGNRCPYCDDGFQMRSVAPAANFSNANARAVLHIAGLPSDELYGGVRKGADLNALARRLLRLRNDPNARREALRPALSGGGETRIDRSGDVPRITGTARWYDIGSDDAGVLRRIEALQEVVAFAIKHDLEVAWG